MDKQGRLISRNSSFERAYMLWGEKVGSVMPGCFFNEARSFIFFLFITQTGENESEWIS